MYSILFSWSEGIKESLNHKEDEKQVEIIQQANPQTIENEIKRVSISSSSVSSSFFKSDVSNSSSEGSSNKSKRLSCSTSSEEDIPMIRLIAPNEDPNDQNFQMKRQISKSNKHIPREKDFLII